jgi:hypothetical protein
MLRFSVPTNSMSITGPGLTAVTTDTRLADEATMPRA